METDLNIVIGNCLKSAFELDKYMYIIEEVKKPGFNAEEEFRKKYNGFYKVRYGNKDEDESIKVKWYEQYYSLLKQQLTRRRSFTNLLEKMHNVGGRVEVSFVSKLMATVNVDFPIWDIYVIEHLGLKSDWEKSNNLEFSERIKVANEIYESIKKWYGDFLKSDNGKAWVAKFDELLPYYKDKISNTKKIDFMIWGQGSNTINKSQNK